MSEEELNKISIEYGSQLKLVIDDQKKYGDILQTIAKEWNELQKQLRAATRPARKSKKQNPDLEKVIRINMKLSEMSLSQMPYILLDF